MEKKIWNTPEIEALEISETALLPIANHSYDFSFGQNGWWGSGEYIEES